MKPHFKWFTADELVAAAGGDPWVIADQLRAGDAGAINDLAQAFHNAGAHVKDADDQFNLAQQTFKESYNRKNGTEHPINEAVEVKKVSAALAGHPEELARVAVDLEQTAAALASAQSDSAAEIDELNAALHAVDAEIDSYGVQIPLVLTQLVGEAKDETTASLHHVEAIQGAYVDQLHTAETAMLTSGYVPDALDDADAVAGNSPMEAAQEYERSGQLAKDQATVDQYNREHRTGNDLGGQDAKRRLADYNTITHPDQGAGRYGDDHEKDEASRLAGERLADFNMVNSTGPVPKDPILGGDMRDRAKRRLQLQSQLENAQLGWSPLPMRPDDATRKVDSLEAQDRVTALNRLNGELQQCGLSPGAAAEVVEGIAHGVLPQEYLDAAAAASKVLDGGKDGVRAFAEALPTGRHWAPGAAFSASDVESFVKLGKHMGTAGSALELGVGLYEWLEEGKSPVEIVAKSAGGLAGAWALGEPAAAVGGMIGGPPGAFILGLGGATAGAFGGEWAVEQAIEYLKGSGG